MKTLRMTMKLLLAAGLAFAGIAQAAERPTIRIGHANWTDSVMMAEVTRYILEEKMNRDVELNLGAIGLLYEGTAKGDIDFHMIAWFPETHRDYMQKVRDRVVDLGAIYTDARLGWVVPDYIPEDQVSSVADLADPEVFERLDGSITGIGPGAGVTRLSQQALEAYGLKEMGYELKSSSDSGMTATLRRAIDRDEWEVVTGWSPHWMFSRWDLRYLEDPKGILGSVERSHVIAHKGFYQEETEVAKMLMRMWVPLSDLEQLMLKAEDTDAEEVAREYVENHPERVNYWITGEI